jgi:hypothetical protein
VWLDHEELTRVIAWVRRGGATDAELPEPSRPAPPRVELGGGPFGDPRWGGPEGLGGLLAGVAAALGRALFSRD